MSQHGHHAISGYQNNVLHYLYQQYLIKDDQYTLVCLEGDLSPLHGFNNYVLIWGDWLLCPYMG